MYLAPKLRSWLSTTDPLRDPHGIRKRQAEATVERLERLPEPRDLATAYEWDEYLHPRDEKGKFVEKGTPIGQGGGHAFHGTTKNRLDSILKDGLKASQAGVIWPTLSGKDRVYITSSEEDAKHWAREAKAHSQLEGASAVPTVLEVEIPQEEITKLIPDANFDDTSGAVRRAFPGDIKPEWIKRAWVFKAEPKDKYSNEEWELIKAAEERSKDTVTLYVPFLIVEEEEPRDLGGPGSGNFGHAGGEGGPGNPGGSTTAGFTPATAAERKALKIPPAWTDVRINPDAKCDLQAVGKDSKERTVYRYSAEHSAAAKAEKFERMKAFEKQLPNLRNQIKADMKTDEAAAALYMIDKTGFRVGGERDTQADVQAYGATTLQVQHVFVDGSSVSFDFIGKKGVPIDKTVDDAKLAAMMRTHLKGKSGTDKVFETDASRLRAYMKTHAEGFTPKDFRTRHATALALSLIKNTPKPTTEKAVKAARKIIATEVAEYLGNTPTVALSSYINPTVFASWEAR